MVPWGGWGVGTGETWGRLGKRDEGGRGGGGGTGGNGGNWGCATGPRRPGMAAEVPGGPIIHWTTGGGGVPCRGLTGAFETHSNSAGTFRCTEPAQNTVVV